MARIFVTSTRTDDRIVLWEQHPDHPRGEALVFNERHHDELIEHAYAVEQTEAVDAALRDGRLRQVSEAEAKEIEQEAAAHVQRLHAEEA